MTKRKQYWSQVSRPKKSLICMIGILLSVLTLYFLVEAPAFSRNLQFRRAEKANLIGPCEILGTEEIRFYRHDGTVDHEYLLVAQDDYGVALYPCHSNLCWHINPLIYREWRNEPLLLAYHRDTGAWTSRDSLELPLILFDNTPDAVRAEITLHLSVDAFQKSYTLRAFRQQSGYFRFTLPFLHEDRSDSEAQALKTLTRISDPAQWASSQISVPYQLRLYDENGQLLIQQDLVLLPYTVTNSKT